MTQPTTYAELINVAQSFDRDAAEAERVHNIELRDFYKQQALKVRLQAQALLTVTK
jgi:hypothetical protein